MLNTIFPVRLEVLTPVFIGTGEELEGFDYVIRKSDDGSYRLHFIDVSAWIADSPQDSSIRKALLEEDYQIIRRAISDKVDLKLYSKAAVKIADGKIATKYRQEIDKGTSQNCLKIAPHIRNALTMRSILPGSSLKGAIRTALFDHLDRKYGLQLKHKEKNYQEVLGNTDENALRALKISDFEFRQNSSSIVTPKERKLNPKKDPTQKTNCEVITPESASKPVSKIQIRTLKGKATIEFKYTVNSKEIQESFDQRKLFQIVNKFYKTCFGQEYEKFYREDRFPDVARNLRLVKPQVDNIDDDSELLLRVGRYSHIECMTIENNNVRGRTIAGTTRTLAGDKLPFGWVKLTICDPAELSAYGRELAGEYADFRRRQCADRTRYREELRLKQAKKRKKEEEAAAERARQEALAKERKKREEEQRRRKEAERQRRESLTWYERNLEDWEKVEQILDEYKLISEVLAKADKEEVSSNPKLRLLVKKCLAIAKTVGSNGKRKFRGSFIVDLESLLGIEREKAEFPADIPGSPPELERAVKDGRIDILPYTKEQLIVLRNHVESFKIDQFGKGFRQRFLKKLRKRIKKMDS